MNVWIVNHYAIPPSMGGLVRHYYFSKYLQQKGHKVKIFTSSKIHNTDINMIRNKSLYKEEMEDGVEYTFVRSRDYKGNGLDRILNMLDLPFKMWKVMKVFYKREKPNVIYTSSPDLFVAFFALCFGKIHKIPVVVEIRDLWPESVVAYNQFSSKNPIVLILYQLEKWIYVHAERLIFTMEGGKQYIKDKGWDRIIQSSKIYHLNNGVDIDEFEKNKEEFIFSDRDLDDDSSFKVVYVGSIRYANHLEDLVNVARILKYRGMNLIKILVYGDGTERVMLEKQCEKERLNMFFKGTVEKKYVPSILSRSNLNLINVRQASINRYGCSWNKLFEYMASQKPILCNLPVNYDLIQKYELGISRRFNDEKEYADAIIEFMESDEEEYCQYCNNNQKTVYMYDYKVLTDKLETILCEL